MAKVLISLLVLTVALAPVSALRSSARCGHNWGHANDNCGTLCPSGSPNDCPRGQNCFGGLSEEICNLAAAERTSPVSGKGG